MDETLKQNIINELGLSRFSPEKQREILLVIGKLIFQGLIIRSMSLLSDDDKNEFDRLLVEKIEDENAVLEFLEKKIPNLEELVNEEINIFKKENSNLIEELEAKKGD